MFSSFCSFDVFSLCDILLAWVHNLLFNYYSKLKYILSPPNDEFKY